MDAGPGRRESDPLCCCEYRDGAGERSHLLALCCDCEAVDRAADSLLSGSTVQDARVAEILCVVEDRLRLPWRGGALRVPIGRVAPCLLLPGLLVTASLHPLLLLLSGLALPAILLLGLRVIFRHRPRTDFFLYWSYASAGSLLYLYEVKLVGLFWDLPKMVSWWENLCLVMLAGAAVLQYWRLRGRRLELAEQGRPCRACGVRVVGRDHHCVWLGLCVAEGNMPEFLGLVLLLLLAALHLALLLSSAACPGPWLGPLLLPKVCWPDSPNSRLLLAGGLYSGLVAGLLLLLLVERLARACRAARQPQAGD